MTLDALIMLSGFLIAVLPFLGFPIQWDNIILMVIGVFVVTLGIFVRRRGSFRPAAAIKEKETFAPARHEEGEGA